MGMAGRILIFVAVITLLILGLMMLHQYMVSRPKKIKDEHTKALAKEIVHKRTLCSEVDSYIVNTELNGEQAPLSLIKARRAVDDAPNDETQAYAIAHLEKEFSHYKNSRRAL